MQELMMQPYFQNGMAKPAVMVSAAGPAMQCA
jgi:hypothetical protein